MATDLTTIYSLACTNWYYNIYTVNKQDLSDIQYYLSTNPYFVNTMPMYDHMSDIYTWITTTTPVPVFPPDTPPPGGDPGGGGP